jgi:CRP/FNR family transcriptional regulator, cyclic AMP receptor protein
MEARDKLWYLEHFDILQRLKKDDIVNMEKAMVMRKLGKNTLLHFPEMKSKYVYFLKEGMVKISNQNQDGKELIKYIIKPGQIFGEMSLLENTEDSNDYAIAIEDCIVCFMDVEQLKSMMQMNADLNLRIRKLIGLRIKKIENRISSMVFKDAPTRIMDFLHEFAGDFGYQVENGVSVKFFLTHEDIAKLTATTRQTVATVMAKARERGLIDYNTRQLTIFKVPRAIGE